MADRNQMSRNQYQSLHQKLSIKNAYLSITEFTLNSASQNLSITLNGEGWPQAFLSVLVAPGGEIRFNKWLRAGEEIVVGLNSGMTAGAGLGSVAGWVAAGLWELRLFFFQPVPENPGWSLTAVRQRGVPEQAELPAVVFGMKGYEPDACFGEAPGWYKGDFHTHTQLSDGCESVASAMEKAIQMGLDFYVPTEHNVLHPCRPETSLLVLPGVEITMPRGHVNILGLEAPPRDFFEPGHWERGWPSAEALAAVLRESAEKGVINSLNHPFLEEWKWDLPEIDLQLFQTMEIINDPTYQEAEESNEKALQFWSCLWNGGVTIWGIGGSDSHNLETDWYPGAEGPSIPGDPSTLVYCQQLTPRSLLEGVRQGRIAVCRNGVDIKPQIQFDGLSCLPGQKLQPLGAVTEVRYRVLIHNADRPLIVQWVINGQTVHQEKVSGGNGNVEYNLIRDALTYTWLRVDLRDERGRLYGFINPVYWGNKAREYRTFREAVCGMEG